MNDIDKLSNRSTCHDIFFVNAQITSGFFGDVVANGSNSVVCDFFLKKESFVANDNIKKDNTNNNYNNRKIENKKDTNLIDILKDDENSQYIYGNCHEFDKKEKRLYIYSQNLVHAKKGLVAKIGEFHLIELEILKAAQSNNFIIKLIGTCVDKLNDGFLIFPKCEKPLTAIQRPQVNFEKFDIFFEAVLDFLEKINYSYLDWKPGNILIDYDASLKLIDFGSCCKRNVEICNPKNTNMIFSSPRVMSFHENIIPSVEDDLISICYIYIWLHGYEFPWSKLTPKISDQQQIDRLSITVFEMKCFSFVHFIDVDKFPNIPTNYKAALQNLYTLVENKLGK